jgi:hypothetical protein
MTTIDIRKKLISKINKTTDNQLLEEMYRLIENEEVDDSILYLSNEQKKVVKEAQSQYRNGKTISNADANNEIDEWLKE